MLIFALFFVFSLGNSSLAAEMSAETKELFEIVVKRGTVGPMDPKRVEE
jgi:hypothetical protein